MGVGCFSIDGQIGFLGSPTLLGDSLRKQGLDVLIGQYAVRIKSCDHFVFCWEGNLHSDEPFVIDADAETAEEMLRDAGTVSNALTSAGIRHSFEVLDPNDEVIAHFGSGGR